MHMKTIIRPNVFAVFAGVVSVCAGILPSAGASASVVNINSSSVARPVPGLASCPGGPKGEVNIADDHGGPYVGNFNPFDAPISADTQSFVYETLLQYSLTNSKWIQPWLASNYAWSDGGRTLTFHLRHNITWSDGKPFTSADVAFTFNLLKNNPATNLKGIVFSSVGTEGPYAVKMTFAQPEYTELYYIGTQYIVPEHIWATIKNPTKFLDGKDPIGTGPYLLTSMTSSDAVLTPNPHYWMKGLPCIAKVTAPTYLSNTTSNEAMEVGTGDWGGLFIGNGLGNYTSHPGHKVWNPPTGDVALYPNLTRAPLNSLPLREAISLALDRKKIVFLGELNQEHVITNQTGVILPRDKYQLAPQYRNANYVQNISKAKAVLKAAGYTFNSKGALLTPAGKVVTLTMGAPAAFSDWITSMTEVASELKAIGIDATVTPIENTEYFTNLFTGKYQLDIMATTLGPNSFYQYDGYMYSHNSAPIGTAATSDYERFTSAKADALINSYLGTNNPAIQQKDMAGLESIQVNQLPIIPMYYSTEWGEYVTTNIAGWPSPSNPYEASSSYDTPMNEVVLLHLTWKG